MSRESDRSIGAKRPLLGILVGVVLASGLVVFAYWWLARTPSEPRNLGGEQVVSGALPVRNEDRLAASFFVPLGGRLEPVAVAIRRQPEAQLEAREALSSLLADERSGQAVVLRDLRLRAFYIDSAGTAYVDLVPPADRAIRGSVWEELLAVYALVNTVLQNAPSVTQVRLLVDGRQQQTLAGHVDLTRPFGKRMDLVSPR